MAQAIQTVAGPGEAAKGAMPADPRSMQTMLHEPDPQDRSFAGKIFVVDDDYFIREDICGLLQDVGLDVEAFSSCEDYLENHRHGPNTCLVLDVHFPGMGGLALLQHMRDVADNTPVIVVSGSSEINEAVQSMKKGALDFIEKPVVPDELVASAMRALALSRQSGEISVARHQALGHLQGLTTRQKQIMTLVLSGHPSKNIAADLGISQRTVENHRAAIMDRTGVHSLPELARLVMSTQWTPNH